MLKIGENLIFGTMYMWHIKGNEKRGIYVCIIGFAPYFVCLSSPWNYQQYKKCTFRKRKERMSTTTRCV